ncbi:molybdopterin-guanine dinucleotide biosynthesis protein B [candidate division KSB3 bacterium]|uniref:Molybdopterin-guanine dinucleotide biosynthesis protein B n=1 Tax=candidate division KSB3 bacterium TaxID=2044937 RepID=A0A9D5JXH4_9BACT|nr:molybdopterin-guanine dinucleotide biosynthesis protein B [candidate division KSB3 bacterium]MBD3326124.1 molybdopterin-guanine dinucleotide biosynthesis protein B [candidate division KSB3 bacterium]
MVPILAIVGRSGSGKTTLIEKLLPEFRRRGYRVGTVKHHLHDFEIDRAGKDSWRHAQAGAETVIIASPVKLAMVKRMTTDLTLEELGTRFFQDVDLVIAEGYKAASISALRIEVFRQEAHDEPLFVTPPQLFAIVTDSPLETEIPRFGLEEIAPLVDLVERAVLRPRSTPS